MSWQYFYLFKPLICRLINILKMNIALITGIDERSELWLVQSFLLKDQQEVMF